jgi:DNA-binding NarL/FixJ family response regulator
MPADHTQLSTIDALMKHPASVKVLVVSDSHLLRSGLRKILEPQTRLRILKEMGFDRVAEAVLAEHPNVVLFDLDPKGNDILAAIVNVQKVFKNPPILLLADLADSELARRALALGAQGIALKTQPPAVLIAAIEDLCHLHHSHHSETVSRPLAAEAEGVRFKKFSRAEASSAESIQKINRLTSREREIIRLVGWGLKNKDIATRLSIADITVRHHLTSIFRKLEVSDRQKLLILAYRFGLAEFATSAESA